MCSDGSFFDKILSRKVYGYYLPSTNGGEIHISPKALYAGGVYFADVFEHELTHACHYYFYRNLFPSQELYHNCTEMVAYKHSAIICESAGSDYFNLSRMYHGISIGYAKKLPKNYTPPIDLKPYYYYFK